MTTIVLSCSDGRIAGRLDELCAQRNAAAPDRVLLPGGPRALARPGTPRGVILDAVRLLARAHFTRRVFLVAHQDCAAYADESGGDRDTELTLLLEDLTTCEMALQGLSLHLCVECYVVPARFTGDEVTFVPARRVHAQPEWRRSPSPRTL